jgi:hypothetical protein
VSDRILYRLAALPRGALALYVPGLCAAALRASAPEWLYLSGLVVGSAGVLWLSVALLRTADQPMPVRA